MCDTVHVRSGNAQVFINRRDGNADLLSSHSGRGHNMCHRFGTSMRRSRYIKTSIAEELLERSCMQVPKVEDILDIPDPVEEAKAVVATLTPAERAKREAGRKVEREKAAEQVQFHDPAVIAANRHNWLIFTVPEKPVSGGSGGEDCQCIYTFHVVYTGILLCVDG